MSVHSSATTLPGSRDTSPDRALSPTRAPSIPIEDDESTANEEEFSDTSSVHVPQDRNPLGWRNLRVPDEETKSIYEAWSIIFVRPTMELRSKTRFLGFDVKSNYVALKDRYSGYRAEPSYTQPELEELVTASKQQYEDATAPPTTTTSSTAEPGTSNNNSNKKRFSSFFRSYQNSPSTKNSPTYTQDLSRRLFSLPDDLPQKIGVLMDNRFTATNKNSHVHREWKVVMLKELDDWAVDSFSSSSSSSSSAPSTSPSPSSPIPPRTTTTTTRRKFSRKQQQQPPPVQKWLLIFRGSETKHSDSGFEAFESFSNPWLKIDERAQGMRLEGVGENEGGQGPPPPRGMVQQGPVPPRAPVPPPNNLVGMGGPMVRHHGHHHPHIAAARSGGPPPPPGTLLRVPLRAG